MVESESEEDEYEGEQLIEGETDDDYKVKDEYLYKIPMFLSIMCFLAKNDKQVKDIFTKPGEKGLIYYRMIRCMYTMYCEKKGKDFDNNAFREIVMSVGKVAWQMLLFGDEMFRKGDVAREVGSEVFEYGLLIGDEAADKLTDETADILVTFAHRSILEFLGAFHFILRLSKGEGMDSLLGGKIPICIG